MERCEANYAALSPLSFLTRAKDVFGHREAVVYGKRRYSWKQVYDRCVLLASALSARGVGKGDVVSVMAANTPELFEAHFGVPMAGGVLNTINTRLDYDTVAYILDHAESKVLITDSQFSPIVGKALESASRKDLLVIDIDDPLAELKEGEGERLGAILYEDLLAEGDAGFSWSMPEDEWQAITLNYTSGTSGRPKGVVYHHRGSYLMSLGTVAGWGLPPHPKYLYTVPMFHCNGWGHAWTMAAAAGTVVCARYVTAKAIYEAVADHKVTHFGGAPVVLGMLVNAKDEEKREFDHQVNLMTAGAPPPSKVLEQVQALGFDVMHVYGLTETFGHVVHCAWQDDWTELPFDEVAKKKACQGVRFPVTEEVSVIDTATGNEVPKDGESQGEIVIRGNTVMKGYFKNPEETEKAFSGGWFHSGDLAVVHDNGYLEIKDRLKDVIISGGENISSIEVEDTLYKHPAISICAVVARPDEKWGETPCAFVELKDGHTVDEAGLIAFCREHLAGFKTPKKVVFGELPKTATGKIQKFVLRQQAKEL